MIHKLKYLSAISLCAILAACSNDDVSDFHQTPEASPDTVTASPTATRHTAQMKFVGDVDRYDQKHKLTKAAASAWADGDKIYLTLYNGDTKIPGEATYDAAKGWSINYNGELATGAKLKCEARHFVDQVAIDPQFVTLNAHTQIYVDSVAQYDFDGSELVVRGNLKPATGRIRFKGTAGAKILITGITYYTTFISATPSFDTSAELINLTVGTDGYTPYIYGYYTDSKERTIGLIEEDNAFIRKKCKEDMLAIGGSAYMTIPTDESHGAWLNGLYVKANGVEFKMIPVAGHEDGFFLIGETEVTKQLWGESYLGSKPITETYQYRDGSYSSNTKTTDLTTFCSTLAVWTDIPFCVPTISQWQYAAQGGNKKVGYTYSGSNNLDDVANTGINTVKLKAPNELGLYDMSGNAEELAYDEQNDKYVVCGGCYYSPNSYLCLPSYYRERPSKSSTVGLRLCLKPTFK